MIYKIFIYIIVLFNNNTYWYLHAMTTRNFQFSSSDCSTDTLFYGMERIDFFWQAETWVGGGKRILLPPSTSKCVGKCPLPPPGCYTYARH